MLPYDELGTGDAVVLLHAGVADRRMWSEHLEPLADAGYRVVAIDLPGFGDAVPGVGSVSPWNDILATMDGLELDRATLVGNSFGGAVALRVAALATRRVRSMVLISIPVPGVEPSTQVQAVWAAEEAALEREDVEGAVDAVLEAWLIDDAPPALRERVAVMQRRAIELQRDAVEVGEDDDPVGEDLDAVSGLDIPTLVIAGARDFVDFVRGAEMLAGALPRARLVVIGDAGHLAPLETPKRFRDLLLEFLSE
jgi:3-oxoadipate enol-lactonase